MSGRKGRGFGPVNFLEVVLIPSIVAGYGMVVGWLLSGLEIKSEIKIESSLFKEINAIVHLAPMQVSYSRPPSSENTNISEIFYGLSLTNASDLSVRMRETLEFFAKLCKNHYYYKNTEFCKVYKEYYKKSGLGGGA